MRISVCLIMCLVYLFVRHNVPLDEGVREFIDIASVISLFVCVWLEIKEVLRSVK